MGQPSGLPHIVVHVGPDRKQRFPLRSQGDLEDDAILGWIADCWESVTSELAAASLASSPPGMLSDGPHRGRGTAYV